MPTKIINFLTTDIWRIRSKNLSRKKSFFIKPLRVFLLALREFNENECQLKASALTFYTLLSIVPVLAMAFGIAKGFSFEKLLEKHIIERVPAQEEMVMRIINFAHSLLEDTKGGIIAGIGVALLFWTVIKVLGNIERSFDDIWGIKKARTLTRKFSDYLSIMLICPVLIITASGITVFLNTQIAFITEKIAFLGMFGFLIFFILKALPYCVNWLVFTFVYLFMPNTKVNFKSGLLAGVIAGTTYQLVEWGYLTFQIGVTRYNAIYGSFAVVPLFLVWLQLSWLIVLFGAEISFAHQNVEMYEFEPDCLRASFSFKRLLSLRIAHLVIKNFTEETKPFTATGISHTLEIPVRLVRQILYELVESGIFSELKTQDERDEREVAYQPAHDVDLFTITYVINALEKRGIESVPVAQTQELEMLSECLKAFGDSIEKSPHNRRLKEI